jgi:hypothetical protein
MPILVNKHTKAITLGLSSLICMFSMSAASFGAEAAPSATELFTQVCLADETKLSKAQYEVISYGKMPKSAKLAMAYANPDARQFKPSPKAYAPKDVANKFVQSRTTEKVLLMLPDMNGGTQPLSTACGVIWPGRHYAEASAEAFKLAALTSPPKLPSPGRPIPYTVTNHNGRIIVAAEYANWTILHISPEMTISKDETQQ